MPSRDLLAHDGAGDPSGIGVDVMSRINKRLLVRESTAQTDRATSLHRLSQNLLVGQIGAPPGMDSILSGVRPC